MPFVRNNCSSFVDLQGIASQDSIRRKAQHLGRNHSYEYGRGNLTPASVVSLSGQS